MRNILAYPIMVTCAFVDFGLAINFARHGRSVLFLVCFSCGLMVVSIIADCIRLDRGIARHRDRFAGRSE